MNIPDLSAQFFLFFSNVPVVITLLGLSYLYLGHAFCLQWSSLILLELIFNVTLKGIFHVPAPGITELLYVFPSGHMQLTTVCYGWLAWHLESFTLRMLLILLCVGQGYGLIHEHYHSLLDVVGALLAALSLLITYRGLLYSAPAQAPWIILGIATGLTWYNHTLYTVVPVHAIYAIEILWIMIVIDRLYVHWKPQMHDWRPIELIRIFKS